MNRDIGAKSLSMGKPFSARSSRHRLKASFVNRGFVGKTAALVVALVVIFSSAVTADEAEDPRDRLIAEQEALLDVYRCFLGIDLELVDRGCPHPSPFQPRNWDYYHDLVNSEHRYTAHGSYRPVHPVGKSLVNLEVSCVAAPDFAYRVEVQMWKTLLRIEPGGTAEVSYRVGGAARTEAWHATRSYNGDSTMLVPSDVDEFLADLMLNFPAPLRLNAVGEGGEAVSVEFTIENVEWVLVRLPYHCQW